MQNIASVIYVTLMQTKSKNLSMLRIFPCALCFASKFTLQVSQTEKTACCVCILALLLHCCSGAKQLCCLGQQATALYVFYLQWNLYEPRVTSTWMSPSVLVLFWRHLISAHGTHSLKPGHTRACMDFKGNTSLHEVPKCGDLNNRQICLTNLCNCEMETNNQFHRDLAISLSLCLSVRPSIHPSSFGFKAGVSNLLCLFVKILIYLVIHW